MLVAVFLIIIAVTVYFRKPAPEREGEIEVLGLFKFKGKGGSMVFLLAGLSLMGAVTGWAMTKIQVDQMEQRITVVQHEKEKVVKEAAEVIEMLNQQMIITDELNSQLDDAAQQAFLRRYPDALRPRQYTVSPFLMNEIQALPPERNP
jgi:hypothetical protein